MGSDEATKVEADEVEADDKVTVSGGEVSYNRLRLAARMDPRPGPRRAHAPEDVAVVSQALIDTGLYNGKATDRYGVELRQGFARLQNKLGVPTSDEDAGFPDLVSLRALGRRCGFRVLD